MLLRTAGFGLGAVNDAEDDDMDVYDPSDPARSGRDIAYDNFESREKVTLGSSKNRDYDFQQRNDKSEVSVSASHTFHDGRPVLAGFVLSDKPVAEDTW